MLIVPQCSSDPESGKYAQYYTAEEVHDMFAPAKATVDAVHEWLLAAGIDPERITQSVNKQWIQLDMKTSEAEDLLQTEYHMFEHAPSGKMSIACDQ